MYKLYLVTWGVLSAKSGGGNEAINKDYRDIEKKRNEKKELCLSIYPMLLHWLSPSRSKGVYFGQRLGFIYLLSLPFHCLTFQLVALIKQPSNQGLFISLQLYAVFLFAISRFWDRIKVSLKDPIPPFTKLLLNPNYFYGECIYRK